MKVGRKNNPIDLRQDGAPILSAAIRQFPDSNEGPGEHHGIVIITAQRRRDGGHSRPAPDCARTSVGSGMALPSNTKERAEQTVLFQGEPTEAFEWFKVDRKIGNVRNQSPSLIRPEGLDV